MQQQLNYINIVGQTRGNIPLSTGGAASGQLAQGIYGVWSPVNDAYISVQNLPLSSDVMTSSVGYLIKAGLAPVPVMVPANGVIVCGSSISSGVLAYEKTGNY